MKIKELINKGVYVCPNPIPWDGFYSWLQSSVGSDDIPNPLILGAWWVASDYDKNQRLKLHLEMAKEHGCLDEAYKFLEAIPESDWVVSNGDLQSDDVAPYLQHEIEWGEQNERTISVAKPVVDELKKILHPLNDGDELRDLYFRLDVYSDTPVDEAIDLIEQSFLSESLKGLFKDLFLKFADQRQKDHGHVELSDYLSWVVSDD